MVSKNPAPWSAVYAGTKAFVYNFTPSIIPELEDTNVTMTALHPGATDTDFFRKRGGEDDKLGPPDAVARDGYEARMAGRDAVVSSWQNKVMDKAGNLMSDKWVASR